MDAQNLESIPLLVTMLPVLLDRWKITATKLADLSDKYHIFSMIVNSTDYYNSMGIDGIIEDLENFIKEQGGKL